MKLALIAAPVLASYLPTVPLLRFATKRVLPNTASPKGSQPRDKVGVNRGSRGGVVFANRAVALVRHEEGVAKHRESDGSGQPRNDDEDGVNCGSGGSVVFAHPIVPLAWFCHEKGVALHRDSFGVVQPRD